VTKVLSEEARRQQINAAEKAWKPGDPNRPIPWRGKRKNVPVITVSVDAAVLNPRSHRIRAQIESHPMRDVIDSDPFSDEAQEIIAELLRETEDFEDLKVNLKEEGQLEPGVVTHVGILVNANCRTVALRDLGKKFIELALLPTDANEQDIDIIESQLQVARDYRREYSYTNQLLLVLDMKEKYGYSTEEIARRLQYAPSSNTKDLAAGAKVVEQMLRILRHVEDMRERSDGALPLTFFDSQKEALQQLDEAYEKARRLDPANARAIRSAYELGIAAHIGYEPLRQVDAEFMDKYVREHLEEQELLNEHVEQLAGADGNTAAETEPEGIDILEETEGEEDVPTTATTNGSGQTLAERLTDILLKSHGSETVELPTTDGKVVEVSREAMLTEVQDAMSQAAVERKADKGQANQLSQPINDLRSARRKLDSARDGFVKLTNNPQFDRSKFNQELEAAKRSLEALEQAAGSEAGAKDGE
jgi:hypothetical protein